MQRKNKLIDTVPVNELRVEYKLFLTPTKTFVAEYNGHRIGGGDTAQEASKQAFVWLKANLAIEWRDAILINFPKAEYSAGAKGLFFDFRQVQIARKAEGHWVKNVGGRPDPISLQPYEPDYVKTEFKNPIIPQPEDFPVQVYAHHRDTRKRGLVPNEIYIEFTQERWDMLEEVGKRFEELEQRIKAMFGEPNLSMLTALFTPQIEPGVSSLPLLTGATIPAAEE